MKEIGKIYETKDYSMFKKLDSNREVKGIQKIIRSIERVGQVLSPILVNENFEVIDGQNRLGAMQKLGLPVQFMISEGIGIEECRSLNIGQSNWTSKDFIKSFAESGNEDYEKLLTLITDYSDEFGYEGVIFMTFPKYVPITGGANYKKDIVRGTLKLNDKNYRQARNNMEEAIDLEYHTFKKINELAARAFWGATSYAFAHKYVNTKDLIKKMKKDPNVVIPCTRTVDELMCFDKLYNKGKVAENKVFMAADFQKRLYV